MSNTNEQVDTSNLMDSTSGFSGTSQDITGAISGRRNSILTDQSDMSSDNFFESTDSVVIDSIKGVVRWASKMEETLKNYA